MEPRFANRGWRSELADVGNRQVYVGETMTVINDTVEFYRYIDCTELTRSVKMAATSPKRVGSCPSSSR